MLGAKTPAQDRQNLSVSPPAGEPTQQRQAAGRSRPSVEGQTHRLYPLVLFGLVVLYMLYAVIERHEKIKEAVQPRNFAINFRNIAVLLVPVVLGLALFRIAAVKLNTWVAGSRWVGFLAPVTRVIVYLAGGA